MPPPSAEWAHREPQGASTRDSAAVPARARMGPAEISLSPGPVPGQSIVQHRTCHHRLQLSSLVRCRVLGVVLLYGRAPEQGRNPSFANGQPNLLLGISGGSATGKSSRQSGDDLCRAPAGCSTRDRFGDAGKPPQASVPQGESRLAEYTRIWQPIQRYAPIRNSLALSVQTLKCSYLARVTPDCDFQPPAKGRVSYPCRLGLTQMLLIPPSMSNSLPIVNADSSDARNTTAFAISEGLPKRPAGTCA